MELDTLDGLAARAFDGSIVRKDLVRRFKGQYPVPTYVAEFLIDDDMVKEHERMLTGGFYAEVEVSYDPTIAMEKGGNPFKIDALRAILMSKRDVLDLLVEGRRL